MAKRLISEHTILDASKKGEKVFTYELDTIITDAVKDRAKQLGITFVIKRSHASATTSSAGAVSEINRQLSETIALGHASEG